MTATESTDETELDRTAPAHALNGFPETPIFDALYADWKMFYAECVARNGHTTLATPATPVGELDSPADPVTAGGDPVVAGADHPIVEDGA